MNGVKARFIATIEKTGDPMAPMVLTEAHSAATRLGKMLTDSANKEATIAYFERLLKDFPKDNSDFAHDPNYIIALCSMLSTSIECYIRSLSK